MCGTNEVTVDAITGKEQLVTCGRELLVEGAIVRGGTGLQERIGPEGIGVQAPVATLVDDVVGGIWIPLSDGCHGTGKNLGVRLRLEVPG